MMIPILTCTHKLNVLTINLATVLVYSGFINVLRFRQSHVKITFQGYS